ncbi:hypothetical protein HYD53_01875 [Mycoplasmopsis bovis]|nr:hypothetical protein [Mycoplasmopsis bovis]QQH72065.1 hypothetical protein HYD53_01875 [Mycoplasmopsis bovis]
MKKFEEDYEESRKKNENLIKNSNYSDVLNKLIWKYIPNIGHKWNYYLPILRT